MALSPYSQSFMPGQTFGDVYGNQFFDPIKSKPLSQAGGFDFMGNLKSMGPLQMLGTAYGAGDVGYNMFTKNNDLYWGPRAIINAGEAAMTAFTLSGGNPLITAGATLAGYMGGKH